MKIAVQKCSFPLIVNHNHLNACQSIHNTTFLPLGRDAGISNFDSIPLKYHENSVYQCIIKYHGEKTDRTLRA